MKDGDGAEVGAGPAAERGAADIEDPLRLAVPGGHAQFMDNFGKGVRRHRQRLVDHRPQLVVGHDLLHQTADDSVPGPADHVQEGRIGQNDAPLAVGGHDPVHQPVDHHSEARFAVGDILEGAGIADRFGDYAPQLVRGERFGDEVEGPLLHRLDRMLDRGVAGDDDDHRVRMVFPDRGQDIESRHHRHHQVDEDDVEMPVPDQRQPLLAVGGQDDVETHLLEDHPARLADPRFVIDHQYPPLHFRPCTCTHYLLPAIRSNRTGSNPTSAPGAVRGLRSFPPGRSP